MIHNSLADFSVVSVWKKMVVQMTTDYGFSVWTGAPARQFAKSSARWSLRTGALILGLDVRISKHILSVKIFLRLITVKITNLISVIGYFHCLQNLLTLKMGFEIHISHSISQLADLLSVRRICTNVLQGGAGGLIQGWVDLYLKVIILSVCSSAWAARNMAELAG